jgi:hypothetical protein
MHVLAIACCLETVLSPSSSSLPTLLLLPGGSKQLVKGISASPSDRKVNKTTNHITVVVADCKVDATACVLAGLQRAASLAWLVSLSPLLPPVAEVNPSALLEVPGLAEAAVQTPGSRKAALEGAAESVKVAGPVPSASCVSALAVKALDQLLMNSLIEG